MGELDENARREIEDALQSEALSETQKRQVAGMIADMIPQGVEGIVSALQDLKKQHEILAADVGNLTESLKEVAGDNKRLQAEFANSRSEGGDDVSPPALDLGKTQLTGGCRCYDSSRAEYNRIICDHMKALHKVLTTARFAGASVSPPDLSYCRCYSDHLTQWEAVCYKCQAVGILGTLG